MDLPSVIDRALSDLEDECLRLRAHNRQLQAALSAAISQVLTFYSNDSWISNIMLSYYTSDTALWLTKTTGSIARTRQAFCPALVSP